MKKQFCLLIALCMMLTVFVGCSNGATSAPSDTPAATTKAAETTAAAQDITIGYSFPTKNNEFWGKSLDYANMAAEALNITLLAQDCDNKQEKQVTDVDNMIASGIDGLVLAPQDASVCPGIVSKCNANNIPVMIVDRWPGDELVAGTDYLGFIGPNDEEAGYQIAMALINAGCKKLVGIGGFQGTSVAEGRKAGLDKAITENAGKVELLQFDWAGENMDQGDASFRNLLQSNPDLDGVWCYNDSLALASVNVAKEKNLIGKIKIGGMDLLGPAIESMEANELFFSTGGHYMQSSFGMIMVFDAINGKMPTEKVVRLDLLNVSTENLDKFKAKYVDNPTPIDYKNISQTFNPEAKTYFELSLD